MPLMSTRQSGKAKRMFSIAMRDWPPASTREFSTSCRARSASSSDFGATYANAGAFMPPSDFRQVQRGAREQLLGRDLAHGEPLVVVIAREGLDRMAVRIQAVGPEVLAHQL